MAGVAVLDTHQAIQRLRVAGKVKELATQLQATPIGGTTGIAHTRWATHGAPIERNAHPHLSGDDIALVHNGIIENHEAFRADLSTKGYTFYSETDSEIAAHLIHHSLMTGDDLLTAVQRAIEQLEGAFALAIISSKEPHRLIAARKGCPLIIGI